MDNYHTYYHRFLSELVPKVGLDPIKPPQLTILVLGEPGVGKTTFITRFTTGEYIATHTPTPGVKLVSMRLPVTSSVYTGDISIVFCEIGGAKTWEVCHNTITKVDGIIFMSHEDTRVQYWLNRIEKYWKNTPTILCYTKRDLSTKSTMGLYLAQYMYDKPEKNYLMFEISTRATWNFEKPVLYHIRRYLGCKNAQFVESTVVLC